MTAKKSKSLKVTVLVDDTASAEFVAEHGFSLWIEEGPTRIVFDTGEGDAIGTNSTKLGINLEKTNILVLSHGHHDHTGGISKVLKCAPNTKVYCHPKAIQDRYKYKEEIATPNGMQKYAVAALKSLPAKNLDFITEPMMISPCIGVTGPIPRVTSYEEVGEPFYLDPERRRADQIEDDLAVWIKTAAGLVLCLGCCHAGFVNTIEYVRKISSMSKIHAVIGGLHLRNASNERLARTVEALRLINPELVVPCHCTGENTIALMRDALGDKRVIPGAVGQAYSFRI